MKKNELVNRLLKEFLSRYQSAGLYHEVNSAVCELMEYMPNLLEKKEDIELFFKYLPQVISETPHESEETPLGHEHYYGIRVFEKAAKDAVSIQEFLKQFIPDEKKEDNNALKYFYEYRPSRENEPSHSNDCEDYRAVFAFQNIEELKKLCRKTCVDFEKLRKESCYHTEIKGIPVFVSYSFDEFSNKGNLELHIYDPDEPRVITGKSREMACEADTFLKSVFNGE